MSLSNNRIPLRAARPIALLQFLLWFCTLTTQSQISINPVPPVCAGQDVDLVAIVTGVYGTESYSFEQYPYSPEPFVGGTPVILGDDEVFPADNEGLDIGFPFCFLNSSVTRFWIGSNGWISFLPGQPNSWTPLTLPDPAAPKSAIFSPWQDWDPSKGSQAAEGYVFYRREGTAPDRKLIVYWNNVPMYNCNSDLGKFMIVIHETTNIIDNHIASKPYCSFQNNTATQGIQNATGTPPIYIANGRNQNSWTVLPGQEESTHFVPSGITWHQGTPTGPVVGAGDHITVPATVTTTYWAVLAACDNTGTYQASVDVVVYPLPVPTIATGDADACQNDIKHYTTQPSNSHYTWTATGGNIVLGGGINDPWADVQWITPGAQSVSVNYRSPDDCEGTTPGALPVTVHVFESPVITTVADEFCPGTDITFTAQPGKTNYVWDYLASGATYVSGGTATDNTVVLKWTTPGPKTITVNYTDGGCTGDPPASKTITIKPVPELNSPFTKSICSGDNTAITLTSLPAGADFAWNAPAPLCSGNIAVCPTGSATGSSISDLLSVTDPNPGTVVYSVVPTLNGCAGLPTPLTVTVNPIPQMTPLMNVLACNGQALPGIIPSGPVAGTTYTWTNTNPTVGIASSGTGDIPPFTATNPGTTVETAIITYSPAAAGCGGPPSQFTVTVNPTPSVDPLADLSLCTGVATPIIPVTGPVSGTTFTWTNSNTLIGLPASGTGDIPPFTTTNGTNSPIAGLISITPLANNCTGPSREFTILVKPIPSVAPLAAQTHCNQDGVAMTAVTGPVSGTTFTWSNSNPSIGLPASGTGDIPAFTAQNAGIAPVAATVSIVTAAAGCTGTSTSYNITVNPTPTVNTPGAQVFCHNTAVPVTPVNGPVSGSAYTWNNNNPAIGLPAGGTGNIPAFTGISGIGSPAFATVTISATANGCTGPSVSYPITFNPLPVPVISGPVTACSGSSGLIYQTETLKSGYQWSISSGGNITAGLFTDQITVSWTTVGPQSLSVSYTDANNCTAAAPTVWPVTVQTLPTPSITAGSGNVCAGTVMTYTTQSGASSYAWNYPPSGVTKISGGGSADDFIELRWDAAGSYAISINYSIGVGCSAVTPTSFPVEVRANPQPLITGNPPAVCGFGTAVYSTPAVPGNTYSWIVTGGAPAAGTGPAINVTWGNTLPVAVDVTETAHFPGISCSVSALTYIPVLNPWPVTPGAIDGPSSVCQSSTGLIFTVPAVPYASTYLWSYSGSGVTITGSGNTIQADFSPTATSGSFTVRGNNACGNGPVSQPFAVKVNALPIVTYASCNDPVTTKNAKPFVLKGGLPTGSGGKYRLNSPLATPLAGDLFTPADPAVVIGTNTIYYTYTNADNCAATSQQTIQVAASNVGIPCLGTFTDPRDNTAYEIVQIGGQCWMRENLRYGSVVPFSQVQRDNCIQEHACLQGDAGCLNFGGLYQWDELMQYGTDYRAQGLCPPGWHIPGEAEWEVLYNFVATPGNSTAGSFLKDIYAAGSFLAIPGGVQYLNTIESFTTAGTRGTFFWTSTYNPASSQAIARGLNEKTPSVSRYESPRINAFPVRCLKD